MAAFLPVNPLESLLRKLLTGEDGRVWQFLTPMAAAPLWFITKHYPELDGSDLVAPEGCDPAYLTLQSPGGKYIGIYTAEERAQAAFEVFKLSRVEFTTASTQGYALLKWLWGNHSEDDNTHFFVNLGVENAFWHIDPDLIEILLERPAPPPPSRVPDEFVDLRPAGDPGASLGPLRDFLAKSPNVRAAFIFGAPPPSPDAPAPAKFDLALVMVDPEDKSLEEPVTLILKAVTPLEEEWSVATLMAPDGAYRQMAAETPPFYAAPGFLA